MTPGTARPRNATFDPSDPTQMTPDDRVQEVAAILAGGVMRWRRNRARSSCESDSQRVCESSEIRLDDLAETRLHGDRSNAPVNGKSENENGGSR